MNNAIQFLNKSVFLSICLHLIGIGIASLSIVGTPDKHGDAIVAEFVSLQTPKARKKIAKIPRQIERLKPTQPEKLHPQHTRVQTSMKATHVPQNEMQFVIDTHPISTAHQTFLAGTGREEKKVLQHELPLRPKRGALLPIHSTLKRVSRPEWTSVQPSIVSSQAAELPPAPYLFE